MKLWPHQTKLLDLVRAEARIGHKSVCCVMATGAGKTIAAAAMAKSHLDKNPKGTVLMCAHRDELVNQAYDAFTNVAGLSCGVIQANASRVQNPYRSVQIASTQTLLARKSFPNISMLILDEVHHYMSDKWSELAMEYKKRGVFIVGLTATPIRADGRGLGDVFDALVCPISVKELIAQGTLVPYQMVGPSGRLRSGAIAQKPIDAYLAHAAGRKAAVFAGNIKAAEEFTEQFRAAGIAAGLVTGLMEWEQRRTTLDAYARGELQVICSVGVLGEGWDDKPTSCVILARSIGSVGFYLQAVGRCLRASPKTGKTDAVIIDLHGSSHEFGPPDEDREFSLDGDGIVKKGVLANPFTQCKGCGVTIEGGANICDLCGIAKPELKAPDVLGVALVKFAAKRREGNEDRARTLARFMSDCVAKGHNPGAAFHRYKGTYGEAPTNDIAQLARAMRNAT